jgi:hypothetical protein
MADVTVRVQLAEQHAVFYGFPHKNQQAVFDRGDVRIETPGDEPLEGRRNARAAFSGLNSLRRNVHWDALDATYFAGYAWWNYLTMPVLLAREDVTITEGKPWRETGQRWRRLEVDFPPDIHTHSRRQTFYVDADGLVRRHDYVARPVGPWAHAAHYCDDHRTFAELVFPTRRRVRPRGPRRRVLHHPTLVALDIAQIEVEN